MQLRHCPLHIACLDVLPTFTFFPAHILQPTTHTPYITGTFCKHLHLWFPRPLFGFTTHIASVPSCYHRRTDGHSWFWRRSTHLPFCLARAPCVQLVWFLFIYPLLQARYWPPSLRRGLYPTDTPLPPIHRTVPLPRMPLYSISCNRSFGSCPFPFMIHRAGCIHDLPFATALKPSYSLFYPPGMNPLPCFHYHGVPVPSPH